MSFDSITIILTRRCNLRCRYCYVEEHRRRAASWPSLRSALDGLLAEGQQDVEVLFTGGEPLLALPVLKRAVLHLEKTQAARRTLAWEIVTNGLLLNDEAVDFLDAHGFVVNLSFDGVREAQSQRGRGTFEKLDALLGRLRSSRPSFFARLSIAMTVSPATVPYLTDSTAYFLSTGVGSVAMSPCVPATSWEAHRIGELDAQFDRVAELVRTHYERTGAVPVTLFRKHVADAQPPRREWICGAAKANGITIDVDGRAYGCVVASASYQPHTAPVVREAVAALALGPVDATDFQERLTSMIDRARACGAYTHAKERYSSYRHCADCEYLGRCYACPLSGAPDPQWSDMRRVPDFVCAFNQVALAHRDRFPCQPTAG